MQDGSVAGFKYFDIKSVKSIGVAVSGKGRGVMRVSAKPDFSECCAEIPVQPEEQKKTFTGTIQLEQGVTALYFRYQGEGWINFWSFTLS